LVAIAPGHDSGVTKSSPPTDDDVKRLLAAVLEFSSVMRRDEPRQESTVSGLGLSRAMREHGLGTRHASSLLSVALHGPTTVTQLARRCHVSVKTASLVAVELERAGLVERDHDPADRRRTILTIPVDKQQVVEEGLKKRAAPLRRTLERLTPEQREGFIRGLELLAQEMVGAKASTPPRRPD
jgi:DNA-binding MarR family transcriptional regulator